MKTKDQILLEQAYDQINEGIWNTLKGTASGLAAGIKQGAQNVASSVAGKLGATVTPSNKSWKQAYAQAQQKSIFSSFIQTAQKEIADFEEDFKKLGDADIMTLSKSHPEILKVMSAYKKLLNYLKNKEKEVQAIN